MNNMRYGLILLMFLLLWPSWAALPTVDTGLAAQNPLSLTPYFSELEDPGQKLTLADVRQPEIAERFIPTPAKGPSLNFGYTHSAYWLRLKLNNTSDSAVERLLEIGYARLETVQFFQPEANGNYRTITTGSAWPFETRPYDNRYFVFPIILPAHSEQDYYFRFQTKTPVVIPARLWTPHAYHRYERNDYIGQAWYFGMASAMVIYNLLLFISLRDRIYLSYIAFVGFTALSVASQNGLFKQFLWLDAPHWSLSSTVTGYSFTLAAMLTFARDMLDIKTIAPKLNRPLQLLTVFFLFFPAVFVFHYQTFVKPAVLLYGATLALIIAIGAYCALKRQRSAYFFIAAYLLFCIGGVIGILAAVGTLPINFFTINAWQYGSALEMLLLAFALADRFNIIRRDKEKAQKAALEAEQLLVVNLKATEHMLETRVAERTAELQLLNRKLEALSATDGLTGLANRRRFDEMLDTEWLRAARLNQPLALAIIDIDWFKKYNDCYGHLEGDQCLRNVAAVLTSSVNRSGDLVARYGGEEFVFIAPATDGNAALNMARQICEQLQTLMLPHATSNYGWVTASIGVAALLPKTGIRPEALVKAADKALYSAKEQGRNRAVLAATANQ